jgi:hypothetical protein
LLELFWIPLAVTLLGGTILLILEYRTHWFSRWRTSSETQAAQRKMARRKPVPKRTETELLVQSRRRCCICFALDNDLTQKQGQIAHLDGDPANNHPDNLAYLCFDHHDQYDSRTRQSKGLTIDEVKTYRAQLYELLDTTAGETRTPGTGIPPSQHIPPSIEVHDAIQIGNPIIRFLRGVPSRLSRVLQIGSGRIEVTDDIHSDQEDPSPS